MVSWQSGTGSRPQLEESEVQGTVHVVFLRCLSLSLENVLFWSLFTSVSVSSVEMRQGSGSGTHLADGRRRGPRSRAGGLNPCVSPFTVPLGSACPMQFSFLFPCWLIPLFLVLESVFGTVNLTASNCLPFS